VMTRHVPLGRRDMKGEKRGRDDLHRDAPPRPATLRRPDFAAVQRLPVVVIIENNQFAYSTATSKQSAPQGTGGDEVQGIRIPG